jgi:nitroimidazol reductase NimA-like FMN-containing flavoprotein (pyridoxamine 5'-phosphate oxidase superfamily)
MTTNGGSGEISAVANCDARTGLRWIQRDECLKRLAAEEVGRLGVIDAGAAVIFPVNYVLDGADIVFRSDRGTKVSSGPRARACFEVDGVDRDARAGWSVVAFGRLEEVTPHDSATWSRVRKLPLEPWAGGEKAHWMRLVTERISGRLIGA